MPTFTGTSGNDFIQGTTGDDIIDGLAGNDVLSGRDGNDDVRGGDGDDTVRGSAGNDVIDGGAGDDFLYGDAGIDVVDGGAGNDYLEGGAGIDTLRGGAGDDELSSGFFAPNEAGELYDGGDGSDFLTFAANFSSTDIVFSIANPAVDQIVDGVTIRNVERVSFTASNGNDTLTGGADRDIFRGEAGNDLIQGLGGNDSLDGYNGNDDLRGGDGDDNLSGGLGDDMLDGGAGNDELDGGVGVDLLYGGSGDDSLRIAVAAGGLADGGDGIDFLTFFVGSSGGGANIVFSLADPSVDQIVEGVTIRNIERAHFTASMGNDTLTGGAYADTFFGGDGNDVIHGGGGNDVLRGDGGADQLFGDDGDDALTYGFADTLLDGGAGVDLATIELSGSGTAITLDVSNPSVDQDVAGTVIRGIEQLHFVGGNAGNQVTGGAYDDFIEGGIGADILSGGGGNDVVSGKDGIDQLFGGSGDDVIYAYETTNHAGDSLIDGGDGFDTLTMSLSSYSGYTSFDLNDANGRFRNIEKLNLYGAGAGGNLVYGGGSDDTMFGGSGFDEFHGRGGDDFLTGDLVYGDEGNDRLEGSGVSTLYGGEGNDSLSAHDSVGSLLDGGAGNDGLRGFSGADTLTGGEGNDYLDGGVGADSLTGGVGNDTYVIDNASDVINELAGEGTDTVVSLMASYTIGDTIENLSGSNSTDAPLQTLIGNAGDNVITGGYNNDTLIGGGGTDSLNGYFGDDTIFVDSSGDLVVEWEGFGRDLVYASVSYTLAAGSEIEILSTTSQSGTAPLVLLGNEFGQEIYGNAGANYLDGGSGNDTLVGFGGDDSYVVDDASDYVAEFAGGGNDIVYVRGSFSLGASQEVETLAALSQAGTAPIVIVGNEFSQFLYGNAGANYLDGGSGNDTLVGFGGDDSYVVDDAGDFVAEFAGGGNDIVYVRGSFSLGASQEVETLAALSQAGTAPIVIVGNDFNQTLYGNAGANYLDGGSGNDTLVGFGGDDSYVVDDVNDFVAEFAGGGNDIVYVRGSFSLGSGQEVETLAALSQAGTAAIVIVGNGIDQRLYGNNGDNYLDGGGGTDILQGFAGNDTYVVDGLSDYVVEGAGEGTDIVYARSSYALAAGQEIEILAAINQASTNAIDFQGNELVNTLYGSAGANILDGGAGGDVLQGFGGADRFTFTTALGGGNVDQIVDFVSGTDKIALDDAIFGAFSANAFVAGTAAQDADDRIVYDGATGQLFFDADGNGAGAQVLFATLQAGTALIASDFVVI